jgi:hypothetical protein
MPLINLIPCDLHVTPCNISHQCCHIAMKLLNMLVPNFESRADADDNLEFFYAPVCVLFYTVYHPLTILT